MTEETEREVPSSKVMAEGFPAGNSKARARNLRIRALEEGVRDGKLCAVAEIEMLLAADLDDLRTPLESWVKLTKEGIE